MKTRLIGTAMIAVFVVIGCGKKDTASDGEKTGAKAQLGTIQGIIENMVDIQGKSFKMGKYEVTQAQWKLIMGNDASEFKGDDMPVEHVSGFDCEQFIEKLNAQPKVKASGLRFRLPTRTEWAFACRAGGTGNYCRLADGTEITADTLEKVAWYNGKTTHPVGEKLPNAFGLYDMNGNVSEWCQDVRCGQFEMHESRGGSWSDNAEDCAAGSGRCANFLASRVNNVGFRLAASQETDANSIVQGIIGNMVDIPDANFKMGRYEVTQEQWQFVMGKNPSEFEGLDNPVERVSWNDCKKFLEKLNAMPEVKASGLSFRLPTAEVWEYVCRAGGTGEYCRLADGTEITEGQLEKVAWCKEETTHPVGQKSPNAFGLYDMLGNVYEWCEDRDRRWDGSLSSDRVARGGCYYNPRPVTWSNRYSPDGRYNNVGFRLAALK